MKLMSNACRLGSGISFGVGTGSAATEVEGATCSATPGISSPGLSEHRGGTTTCCFIVTVVAGVLQAFLRGNLTWGARRSGKTVEVVIFIAHWLELEVPRESEEDHLDRNCLLHRSGAFCLFFSVSEMKRTHWDHEPFLIDLQPFAFLSLPSTNEHFLLPWTAS